MLLLLILILKDKILTKHKLQDKFDEVDKMKEDLEKTKKIYQEDIEKLMEDSREAVEYQNVCLIFLLLLN